MNSPTRTTVNSVTVRRFTSESYNSTENKKKEKFGSHVFSNTNNYRKGDGFRNRNRSCANLPKKSWRILFVFLFF